ncbi:AMP-binding protein [Pseudooceanicola aestuarii]|uniref:AMP-binding protein n=1 Tax=Pseudooceanicola aestuarii TaxID=2697319 RepID=UPI0013CF4C2B|nr:AMP-binding protein [Pseudooceanicola aestuarii]
MTPALWLARTAEAMPDRPALFLGTRQICHYAGLAARVAQLAGGLAALGVRPGDRVAVFCPNGVEVLPLMHAIWWAGAAAVPINAKLHAAEAGWMLDDSGACLAFDTRGDLVAHAPADCPVITLDDAGWRALDDAPPMVAPVPVAGGDLCWLFYTSGTTGRPKGVMLTNDNIQSMVLSYFTDVDEVETGDATLYAAPMSHGAGLYAFMHVIRGARHVVPESGGFDPAEIEGLARHFGALHLFAAPTMVRRMVVHARQTGWDGTGLKTVVYGGGPMYVADIVEAVEILGPRFAQIYGQGESPMTITAMRKAEVADRSHPDWRARLGSVGRAQSSVALRIKGAQTPGAVGEVLVRGTPVMAGYWRNPQASAETLQDGWLHTGDVGRLDAAGFLTLQDRSKDVIISGGTNIYPREVEEALLTHPGVAECSVIGHPDPEWGEVVVAFVVCDGLAEREMNDHLTRSIARFKRPKRYVLVPELPKNAYGKVLKTELRARLDPAQ